MVEVSSKEEDAADYHVMGQFRYIHTYGYYRGWWANNIYAPYADRMTAAVDLKLKLHVCLIYYNSQM